MATRTIPTNYAEADRIATAMTREGIPLEVTAALMPALISEDPAVSRAAHEWALSHARIGTVNDGSPEAATDRAVLQRQARALTKSLGVKADPEISAQVDPGDKAVNRAMDENMPFRGPTSGFVADQKEPEPLRLKRGDYSDLRTDLSNASAGDGRGWTDDDVVWDSDSVRFRSGR